MQFDTASIFAAMRATVQEPRRMARAVMALDLPLNTASLALLIVALLTALISALVSQLAAGAQDAAPMISFTPLQWAIAQVASMFAGAAIITAAGRWFGGQGTLPQAVVLLAWAEFIVLMVQVAQVVALFILPPLTLVLAVAGIVLTLWLIVNFIAEMHGFSSILQVFFGMIGVGFALIMVFATILATVFGAPA